MPDIFEDIILHEIRYVYDGDTFKVDIPGYPPLLGKGILVRVWGIDAPRIRRFRCLEERLRGRMAKNLLEKLLVNATEIELRHPQRDKYFRILAEIFVDGQSVQDLMIASGLAVEYMGKTKQGWCS